CAVVLLSAQQGKKTPPWKAKLAALPSPLGLTAAAALVGTATTGTLARKLVPPLVLTVAKVCTLALAASLRASYQLTARLPVVWSTAAAGRNWLGVPVSSLARTALPQLVPPLVEVRTKMLVSLLSSVASSV